jgi:hypothetical protein
MNTTPAAKWRESGEPDPVAGWAYDGERSRLCRGELTDDELANEVYLSPGIANLTAAKERIRWLSRALIASQLDLGLTKIALDHKTTLLDSCEKALAERDGLSDT